jgi:hypothetical protein
MKNLRLLLVPALLTFPLLGQTAGTITVNGTNPIASSITNTSDATLAATVALGTLTPANDGVLTVSTPVAMRLRSNKAYKVTAQATALTVSGPGADDGGSPITLSDIGFGVTSLVTTGANVATGHTDTIVSKFNYTSAWPTVTNGLTPFVAGTNGTLNDITADTQILSGSRISAKGNISTNNNFILLSLGVATLPQYFTPNTTFSTTITVTLTIP